jgi:metallo-beta-lactamase family protein
MSGATLTFCGGAGTVTGSCFLLTHGDARVLVDCGLFQGPKTLKALNYGKFPFDPGGIDALLLTHAHIDHAGLAPKLIRQGFSGPVFATEATRDLLSFMLPDSGYIQETEVERLNRRNRQRGLDAVEPIYTRADGAAAIGRFRTVDYERWTRVGTGIRARWWNAGHILGSASLEIEIGDNPPLRLLFSGDIGPENKLFHPAPDAPGDVDYLICESTYGGRGRERMTRRERRERFGAEVRAALGDGGVLLIPAFAVERTQELLADLIALMDEGRAPPAEVFLDSPLAIRATEVFGAHADELEDIDGGPDPFSHPRLRFTETVDESKAIARVSGGAIIIAASGMCDAGRVRHHLKRLLWQPRATVLLVGYQAHGTLGALLAEGRKAVRIMGEDIQVRARIRQIDLYSGHADGGQLVDWVLARRPVRRGLFLTHGEGAALTAFRDALAAAGIDPGLIRIPELDESIELETGKGRRARAPRLSPEAVGRLDWHNELAQFSLDLRAALETAPDEAARAGLLSRLRDALEGRNAGTPRRRRRQEN